eukprot:8309874-Pyramimonas_sp.AAC.1
MVLACRWLYGLANTPVTSFPRAASMNTAAFLRIGAVHKSRIGTSKAMEHEKNMRTSQLRTLSTCVGQSRESG